MVRYYLFLTAVVASLLDACTSASHDQQLRDDEIDSITFGSCSRHDDEDQLWEEVMELHPDIWIWTGDNIYGDTEDMALMQAKYAQQKNRDSYQELLKSVAYITGIWDDHDFGVNDGGREYPKKAESKSLMLDFLDVPSDDPRRAREGGYGSYEYGNDDRKVKVILLDTRFFRDPLEPDANSTNLYLPNTNGTILGEDQWNWLETELKNSKARINIIVSSIQVIANDHGYEKWGNFPNERDRLFNLLSRIQPPGVILISGDRHIAEFSQIELPGLPYPLVDFTSSGLTHTWSRDTPEENTHRIGEQIIAKNFGLITIDWDNKPLQVIMEVRGKDNQVLQTHSVSF